MPPKKKSQKQDAMLASWLSAPVNKHKKINKSDDIFSSVGPHDDGGDSDDESMV
jgi:hypothetical protein